MAENITYQKQLGARLRDVRKALGLSLQAVEDKSAGHWKAVVLGSYERADRAITVARLAELADFYGVPVVELLPTTPGRAEDDPLSLALDCYLGRAVDQWNDEAGRTQADVRAALLAAADWWEAVTAP